jgi:protein-L-isoaspartate O-methyltransferase
MALQGLCVFAQPVLFAQHRAQDYSNHLAPYVVSPPSVVDVMLEMADLKAGEIIYDLGSGDGRILISAAQKYRAKGVGIEIQDDLVRSSEARIARLGLQNQIKIIHADLRNVDLSPADVVTMYLMTESNESIRPKLESSLRPGVRVVSHDYRVPGWKPTREERAEAYAHKHVVYLYVMPPRK